MTVPVNAGAAQATVEPVLRELRERDRAREVITRFDSAAATVEQMQDYADAVRLIHPRETRDTTRHDAVALALLAAWTTGCVALACWFAPGGAGPFRDPVLLGLAGAVVSIVVIAVAVQATAAWIAGRQVRR